MTGSARRILVTGGAGFIGSHFTRLLRERRPEAELVVLDKLTYAGRRENLEDLEGTPGFEFIEGDICDQEAVDRAMAGAEAVVNFAAETHVDRSLLSASDFIRTDVLGTHVLLEAARRHQPARFLQVSTDEVYGDLPTGRATEDSPLRPRSPYSASKAGGDLLCLSYRESFGLPILITRGANTYGPNQFPEKIIPLFLTNALEGEPLPLYGDGSAVRDYIHVSDHCEGILAVLTGAPPGSVVNIGSGSQVSGAQVADAVLALTGRGRDLVRMVADRPGHDYRYALDSTRLRDLGWSPRVGFAEGMESTFRWYRDHESWWRPLKGEAFQSFYRANYRT